MTKTNSFSKYSTAAGSIATDNPKFPYIVIRPKDHDGWMKEREYGVGASDSGKLVGCSGYGTPLTLFLDKLGLSDPVEENWAMEQGHIHEPVVARMFSLATGHSVIGINFYGQTKQDWIACSREYDFLRVSPDYLYWLKDEDGKDLPHSIANRGVLECKTSIHNFTPDCIMNECISWYCQIQYQMHVLGAKEGYLAFRCIESKSGGQYWHKKIEYDENFCKNILIPAIVEFWNNHVIPARLAPNNEEAVKFAPDAVTGDDVKILYKKETSGKSISTNEIEDFYNKLEQYNNRKAEIKELEALQKAFEDEVRLAMLDSESIVDVNGKTLVTYKASKPSVKFDSTRFKAENPDLFDQYCNEQAGSRRMVFK